MATNAQRHHRRWWAWSLTTAALAGGGIAWQAARPAAWAEDFFGGRPIGAIYSHTAPVDPDEHLGDVPATDESYRSLGDTRLRQYDELDRPRYAQRLTHRGATINTERFTVVATTNEADAQAALAEFTTAWERFSSLADQFTQTHRNPDFGLGQILIVVTDEPWQDRSPSESSVQYQNGQVIVRLLVGAEQPEVADQAAILHQAAVQTLLHLGELDRKFPLWVQQGLADYTAAKLQQQRLQDGEQQSDREAEAFDHEPTTDDSFLPEPADAFAAEPMDDVRTDILAAAASDNQSHASEYWRLPRAEPDRLAADNAAPTEALAQVTFLLEGDDAAHAQAFLATLASLAEVPTDRRLASRSELAHTQLLNSPVSTVVDELIEGLNEEFAAWQADPLRGQPLFLPSAEIPDPAMLGLQKQMELVLKLSLRAQQLSATSDVRPRVTEFADGVQHERAPSEGSDTAVDVERLYYQLADSDAHWATVLPSGELLLAGDDEGLRTALGLDEQRYTTEFRDGHWVLTTAWNDEYVLDAWLERNENHPQRPLVKFAARPRTSTAKVAELDVWRR